MVARTAARSACRAARLALTVVVAYTSRTAACTIVGGVAGVSAAAVTTGAALTMTVGIRHIVAVDAVVCAGIAAVEVVKMTVVVAVVMVGMVVIVAVIIRRRVVMMVSPPRGSIIRCAPLRIVVRHTDAKRPVG